MKPPLLLVGGLSRAGTKLDGMDNPKESVAANLSQGHLATFLQSRVSDVNLRSESLLKEVEKRDSVALRSREWLHESQKALRELLWDLDRFEPMVSPLVESRRSALERAIGDLEREERAMNVQECHDMSQLHRELVLVELSRRAVLRSTPGGLDYHG